MLLSNIKDSIMEWKVIDGYPNYAISSEGQVKSLRFNRLLKPAKNSSDYYYVNLVESKVKKTVAVHKIVIENFISKKPFENAVVDHKDGNKLNNHIENLEWVHIKENTLRAYNNQDKKEKVKELRAQGWTMQKIADHMNMSLGFVQSTIHCH
jgi:hypothetical protein